MPYTPDPDPLVEELLGLSGEDLPDRPVLLGEFTPEEAEDMGALHDEALAGSPELRGLGRPLGRPGDG